MNAVQQKLMEIRARNAAQQQTTQPQQEQPMNPVRAKLLEIRARNAAQAGQPVSQPTGALAPVTQFRPESGLDRFSRGVSSVYEGYKNLPGIKQLGQAGGAVLGGAGYVVGGLTGGAAQVVQNVATGKDILSNVRSSAKNTAQETGNFGRQVGTEGAVNAPLGALGRLGTVGRLANTALAVSQGNEGYNVLKNAESPEDYVSGGIQLATALAGARGSSKAEVGKLPSRKTPGNILRAPVENVKDVVTAPGRGVKAAATAASDAITPIEPALKTELTKGKLENNLPKQKNIVQRFSEYKKQAELAKRDYSQATPLELAGNKADEALGKLNDGLKTFGEQKTSVLAQRGNQIVPDIQKTRGKFNNLLADRLGIRVSNGEVSNLPGRLSVIEGNPMDIGLAKQVDNILQKLEPQSTNSLLPAKESRATLQQVNDAVDSIQGKLYERSGVGAQPINTRLEGVIKQVIGDLNERAKVIGGDEYRQANANYSRLVELRNNLNKSLGTDSNKGGAMLKQLFSPAGAKNRKMFEAIKKETGIDLVNEATLARFAMQNAGDVRQASLLEGFVPNNIPTTKAAGLMYLLNKGVEKLQDPSGKARRIIQNRRY